MAPKPAVIAAENARSRLDPREVESLVYMSVGAAIAFLVTASLMFAACQCIAAARAKRANGGGGRLPATTSMASDRQLVTAAAEDRASQYSLDEMAAFNNEARRYILCSISLC